MWRMLCSVETLVQYGDLYAVCRLLYSMDTCNAVQRLLSLDFYPVWTLLFFVEIFIQGGGFYPAKRLLSVNIFTKFKYFYQVWRILSSLVTFVQYKGFYPVRRLLYSMEICIQCGHLYPM